MGGKATAGLQQVPRRCRVGKVDGMPGRAQRGGALAHLPPVDESHHEAAAKGDQVLGQAGGSRGGRVGRSHRKNFLPLVAAAGVPQAQLLCTHARRHRGPTCVSRPMVSPNWPLTASASLDSLEESTPLALRSSSNQPTSCAAAAQWGQWIGARPGTGAGVQAVPAQPPCNHLATTLQPPARALQPPHPHPHPTWRSRARNMSTRTRRPSFWPMKLKE